MADYGWYILKVSICIIVFYTFYIFILRNYTFFLFNRIYLVSGLILSFIIPALNFSIFEGRSNNTLSNIIHPFFIEPEYEFLQPQNLSNHAETINYSTILSVIYFTGLFILFFKLLLSVTKIIRTVNNSEIGRIGSYRIIKTKSNSPFSFFNLIFLPEAETDRLIIEHEMAHVRQYHRLDLILVEIASLLLWFNPVIIFYKKSLKLQHEYLADASVIKDKNRIESYLNCMLKHIQIASHSEIVSQFYCRSIKKRIIMITKNKTSNKYSSAYLFVLPLICFMLYAFSNAEKEAIVHNTGITKNDQIQPSIYPINSKKIKHTSGYGERINPKTKKKHFHYGMDFAISEGEDVLTTAGGVVIDAKFDSKKGNYIIVKHNEIFSTFYSHLKSISVQVGDKLEKGQLIGYSGNTGTTTGAHLHYEVFREGKNVNPKDYLPE